MNAGTNDHNMLAHPGTNDHNMIMLGGVMPGSLPGTTHGMNVPASNGIMDFKMSGPINPAMMATKTSRSRLPGR
jgi:hypothetical protein